MLRLHMDEVNIEPVDAGDEVGIGVDPRFDLSPVVLVQPVIGELADRIEADALRVIVDGFALGPSGRGDPALQVGELVIGRVKIEGPDRLIANAAKDDCLFGFRSSRWTGSRSGLRGRKGVRTA